MGPMRRRDDARRRAVEPATRKRRQVMLAHGDSLPCRTRHDPALRLFPRRLSRAGNGQETPGARDFPEASLQGWPMRGRPIVGNGAAARGGLCRAAGAGNASSRALSATNLVGEVRYDRDRWICPARFVSNRTRPGWEAKISSPPVAQIRHGSRNLRHSGRIGP